MHWLLKIINKQLQLLIPQTLYSITEIMNPPYVIIAIGKGIQIVPI